MNDHILKKAALELQVADDNDIVKIAGIFARIKNWWRAFNSPQYKERIWQLKEQSARVKGIIDLLGENIESLQMAIKDNDVPLYEQSLGVVRDYSLILATELGALQNKAEEATKAVPEETKEVENGSPEIDWVVDGYKKDPKIIEQLRKQLPKDHDVPIGGGINTPITEIGWFKQFTIDNISIKQKSIDIIKRDAARAIVHGDKKISLEFAEKLVNDNFTGLIDNLKTAMLNNAIIFNYRDPRVSKEVSHRPVNQMAAEMAAYAVRLPNTNYLFDFKTIGISDMMAAFKPGKSLNISMIKNISLNPLSGKENITPEQLKQVSINKKSPPKEQPKASRIDELKKFADDHWNGYQAALKRDPEGVEAVLSVADRHGIPRAELARVIEIESGWMPNAINPQGNAVGLIQFMPFVLNHLGFKGGYEEFKNLSMSEQASWIDAYMNMYGNKLQPGDMYVATAGPGFLGQSNDTIMYDVNSPAWKENPTLRESEDGPITVGSVRRRGTPPTQLPNELPGLAASESAISQLNSSIQPMARELIQRAYAAGIPVAIGSGARSSEEQNNLYNQGRTTPGAVVTNARGGDSWHNFGLAFDLAKYDDGKLSWPNDNSLWENLGKIGQDIGLTWGGTFQNPDWDHFEYHPDMTLADARAGKQPVNQQQNQGSDMLLDQEYDALMQELSASGPIEKLVKKAIQRLKLPTTRILLTVNSNSSVASKVRFANVLSSALRSEIDADVSIHNNKDNIELECDILGSNAAVSNAIKAVSDIVSDGFKKHGFNIETKSYLDISSEYDLLTPETSEENYRKFAFEIMDSHG